MAPIVRTGAMVVVDHTDPVQWYGDAARNADRKMDVLVDLDVGDHRTGAGLEHGASGSRIEAAQEARAVCRPAFCTNTPNINAPRSGSIVIAVHCSGKLDPVALIFVIGQDLALHRPPIEPQPPSRLLIAPGLPIH